MNLKDILTIVIPLKGRPEYTKRILEYSNWINCPFKILLGDGGNENLKLNKNDFPDIDFEHIKYPYDKDIQTYSKKMSDLISKVETPLTMMIDNDNFYCLDGVFNIIKFLYENKDFIGGRGCLTRCMVVGNKLDEKEKRKMHYHPSIIGKSAGERVVNNINLFHTHLHDIVKTNILQNTHNIIKIVASNDFKIFIRLNALCSTPFGNNYRNDNITYFFHEDRTPRIIGQILPLDGIWVQEPYWEDSMLRMTCAVGNCISYIDNLNLYDAKKIFVSSFIENILNKTDGHKIPENNIKLKQKLKNSIDLIVEKSFKLNFDNEIKDCLKNAKNFKNFEVSSVNNKLVNDEIFRKILNSYLIKRKFCI